MEFSPRKILLTPYGCTVHYVIVDPKNVASSYRSRQYLDERGSRVFLKNT